MADLDRLASKLQPLLRQREALCCDGELTLNARKRAVEAVEAALREAGLPRFIDEVAQLSRAFLRRSDFWRVASRPLDPEDFVMEVLIRLTGDGLQGFDPRRASFATWLKASVLRTTFAEMKRRDNPYWGRSTDVGERATRSRAQAQAINSAGSLDVPVGQGETPLLELVGSNSTLPEQALLEEQCACRFRAALDQLSPEEQVLIERAYLFDETHDAIARSLGVTRAAVTRRLGRICARLVALLGDSFCQDCQGTEFARTLLRDNHD